MDSYRIAGCNDTCKPQGGGWGCGGGQHLSWWWIVNGSLPNRKHAWMMSKNCGWISLATGAFCIALGCGRVASTAYFPPSTHLHLTHTPQHTSVLSCNTVTQGPSQQQCKCHTSSNYGTSRNVILGPSQQPCKCHTSLHYSTSRNVIQGPITTAM